MTDLIRIDRGHPDPAMIEKAVAILRAGGVIAYPTETFYGLGVDGENETAIEKIFLVKGREFKNPVALIMGDEAPLSRLAINIPASARALMSRFWPGPLTLIFEASPSVSTLLTAGSGKIGVRVSSHPVAQSMAGMLGKPITATSANLSGAPECITAAQVMEQLAGRIDAVVDGGVTAGGTGSTFLDVTVEPPVVLRTGAVQDSAIRDVLEGRA